MRNTHSFAKATECRQYGISNGGEEEVDAGGEAVRGPGGAVGLGAGGRAAAGLMIWKGNNQ